YGPRSNATTSRSGSRRRAVLAALIPAASPPTIASRLAIVAQTLPAATDSPPCPSSMRADGGVHAPTVSDCVRTGTHHHHGVVCPLTSLADTPWMTEAVDALARELRLHHAPTADHSHRLATLARHAAKQPGHTHDAA